MGTVDPALERMFDAVRDEVALPVIIVLEGPLSGAIEAQVRGAGAGPVKYRSPLASAFGTTATKQVAYRIAQVPGVKAVASDDPVVAFRGAG